MLDVQQLTAICQLTKDRGIPCKSKHIQLPCAAGSNDAAPYLQNQRAPAGGVPFSYVETTTSTAVPGASDSRHSGSYCARSTQRTSVLPRAARHATASCSANPRAVPP